jgi:single-strand DNA-binding protein
MYKFKGTIKEVKDTQIFETKSFKKREFILTESESKYPQTIKFELFKDNCNLIEGYKIGEEVEVKFNVRGREYNGNYYVSLEAYKLIGTTYQSSEPKSLMIESETGEKLPF